MFKFAIKISIIIVLMMISITIFSSVEDESFHSMSWQCHDKDNFEKFKNALTKVTDINTQDSDGQTALLKAVNNLCIKNVELLLQRNPNVNIPDNEGNTPLHMSRDYRITRLLLKNGASINKQNNLGMTPLCRASQYCSVKVIEELVINGANINIKDKQGLTSYQTMMASWCDSYSKFDISKILFNKVNPGEEKKFLQSFTSVINYLINSEYGIIASSYLIEKNFPIFFYSAYKAIDDDNNTSWVEGAPDDGINEYVFFRIPEINQKNLKTSYALFIVTGCAKSIEIFKNNNRVKSFTFDLFEIKLNIAQSGIFIDGKPKQISSYKIFLKDTMDLQNYKFNLKLDEYKDPIMYIGKITINSIYKGNKFNDTGISEIYIKAM